MGRLWETACFDRRTQGHETSEVTRRLEVTTAQFPTGCAGLWKTLVSIRRLKKIPGCLGKRISNRKGRRVYHSPCFDAEAHDGDYWASWDSRKWYSVADNTRQRLLGWSPFRPTNGTLFDQQYSGGVPKVVPFSINKWYPFRLTKTPKCGSPPRVWGQCHLFPSTARMLRVHPHVCGDNFWLPLFCDRRPRFTPTCVGTITLMYFPKER
jgi:hypothetical protein